MDGGGEYPTTDDGYLYVPNYSAIPTDYDDIMCVPLTYLTHLNQNIFKIISTANPIINGVQMFKGLHIKVR